MNGPDASPQFGSLLRAYRLRAGLSQERLAERAGISAKAVGAVEQGVRRTPHRQTVVVLADALALSSAEREALYDMADGARARARRERTAAAENPLPQSLTPFIARPEVDAITALVATHRLVTITGTGGVGKTRTAIEVCLRRIREGHAPPAFIDLSPAIDGSFVVSRIAGALKIALTGTDPIATLASGIGLQQLFLVLDNCEHVVAGAAEVISRLLRSCPSLSILATSREVLSLSNEVVYRLPSLRTPEATALFLQRATYADATFAFQTGDLPAVASICQKLDGIPLAIELAASQLPKMGLQDLNARLSGLFDVAGPRDFPARQQTMRATIAWSIDLLDPNERAVFMRTSVFSGGFTIGAAESVTASTALPSGAVLGIIDALLGKSLLNVDWQNGSARYTLLDSIRTFGRDMLATSGDAATTARRHAEWVARLADTLTGKPQSRVQAVQREIDNARAAIAWCLAGGEQDMLRLAVRIIVGMRRMWSVSGRAPELDRLIRDVLAKLDDVAENDRAIGDLYYSRVSISNNVDSTVFAETKLVLERTGNFEDAAMVDVDMALRELRTGALEEAAASYARATAHFDAVTKRVSRRNYIHYRSIGVWLHVARGNVSAALADIIELQREAEPAVDSDQLAGIYQLHAEIESAAGNFAAAIDISNTLLDRCKADLAFYQAGTIMSNLSCYHLMTGNLGEAERCGQLALAGLADWQNDRRPWDAVIAMQHLATASALRGHPRVAAVLLGFIDAYRATVAWRLPATDQRSYDMLVRSVAEQLGAGEIAEHRARGAQLDYDAAVDLVQLQDV